MSFEAAAGAGFDGGVVAAGVLAGAGAFAAGFAVAGDDADGTGAAAVSGVADDTGGGEEGTSAATAAGGSSGGAGLVSVGGAVAGVATGSGIDPAGRRLMTKNAERRTSTANAATPTPNMFERRAGAAGALPTAG